MILEDAHRHHAQPLFEWKLVSIVLDSGAQTLHSLTIHGLAIVPHLIAMSSPQPEVLDALWNDILHFAAEALKRRLLDFVILLQVVPRACPQPRMLITCDIKVHWRSKAVVTAWEISVLIAVLVSLVDHHLVLCDFDFLNHLSCLNFSLILTLFSNEIGQSYYLIILSVKQTQLIKIRQSFE